MEFVSLNDEVRAGVTAPQVWSLALMAFGATLVIRERRGGQDAAGRRVLAHAGAG